MGLLIATISLHEIIIQVKSWCLSALYLHMVNGISPAVQCSALACDAIVIQNKFRFFQYFEHFLKVSLQWCSTLTLVFIEDTGLPRSSLQATEHISCFLSVCLLLHSGRVIEHSIPYNMQTHLWDTDHDLILILILMLVWHGLSVTISIQLCCIIRQWLEQRWRVTEFKVLKINL